MVSMCRVLRVHRSGFYAWIRDPLSARSKEDIRLVESIKIAYEESGGIYGSPRVYKELRERGERCGEKRVARIMRQHSVVTRSPGSEVASLTMYLPTGWEKVLRCGSKTRHG